jgi:hypothetical protein
MCEDDAPVRRLTRDPRACPGERTDASVCTENSSSGVAVMKSAQDAK